MWERRYWQTHFFNNLLPNSWIGRHCYVLFQFQIKRDEWIKVVFLKPGKKRILH